MLLKSSGCSEYWCGKCLCYILFSVLNVIFVISESLEKSHWYRDFRQIAKAPDGSRLFWGVREGLPPVNIPDIELVEQVEPSKHYPDLCSKDGPMEALRNPGGRTLRNERASFLVGHAVYGDAILATVGSTWASEGRCIYDDFTLSCFHRYYLSNTQKQSITICKRDLSRPILSNF